MQLDGFDLGADRGERLFEFRVAVARIVRFGEFEQDTEVIDFGDQLFERFERRRELPQFADEFLGLFAVIPKAGRGHFFVDRIGLLLLRIVVKESPGDAQSVG